MRNELTDHEWAAIRPMLPNKPRGVPRVNDRRVLNGIFWVLRRIVVGLDSYMPAVVATKRLLPFSSHVAWRDASRSDTARIARLRLENARRSYRSSLTSLSFSSARLSGSDGARKVKRFEQPGPDFSNSR
jgi:hypothetical protein